MDPDKIPINTLPLYSSGHILEDYLEYCLLGCETTLFTCFGEICFLHLNGRRMNDSSFHCYTLKMLTAGSYEILIRIYQTVRHRVSEDRDLHVFHCKKLKSQEYYYHLPICASAPVFILAGGETESPGRYVGHRWAQRIDECGAVVKI
jgi:hypothetical protein